MAKAKEKHTPNLDWDLTDLHRYLCVELGYEIDPALREIENAIATGRLELKVQGFVMGIPQGDAVKVDPFDFRIDFELKFDRYAKMVMLVQIIDREWSALFFEGSKPVPFVERRYTISEEAARVVWPASPESDAPLPQPITPSKKANKKANKKAKPTQHARLVTIMENLKLKKSGMLPREVRKAVTQPYKNEHHEEPSDSAIARAYGDYLSGITSAA
jgi:hypothetical protein